MKRLTALALLIVALAAMTYFLYRRDAQPIAPQASGNSSPRDPSPANPGSPPPAERPSPTSAPSAEQAAQPRAKGQPPATAARIELRAPESVRSGDTFTVTVDVQALREMRHLGFAVAYKKSLLLLLGSAPGVLGQRAGISVQFEESSDGYLLVRVDFESGVIAGTGSVAVLEFQALKRGVSPLSAQDVTYVEVGGQGAAATSDGHERSITVD